MKKRARERERNSNSFRLIKKCKRGLAMLKKALAFSVSLFAWRSGCLQSSGGFGLGKGGMEQGMRGLEGKGEREGVTVRRNHSVSN